MPEKNFMPEMQLRQPWFAYSTCGPFAKKKETIQKFQEWRYSRCFCLSELNKNCYQHEKTHIACKDLPRRTAADKLLRDKAFDSNLNYGEYQLGLA